MIAWVLLAAGTLVVVASSVAAVLVRDFYRRLHFLTPVTSIGAPLIGLALAVENGWGLTTAIVLLTVALLAFTAPVLTAAVGRVGAQRDGIVDS
ncbi:monovalent cation/H(+) antiporter subunit G [Kutzneria buriramensis]|uniref:Multicomponent Na+:H+ antiporter subunit G n=1 Tax=Kutzneria buriramensis TaxID=1045776 RepID=A0A3E0H7V0_9PSEU|nr:monovalent cation/H(+) antiporter subunit G [Kutzneria buriramensis]REH39388.1 multicomponent Na+:H+ antiporter subunit G [Kutzneria buriramensis]